MIKELSIAQLHWGFPPIIGGVETHLTLMLPEMVRLGHKVSLLTGSVEDVSGEYEFKGVKIFRTPLMDLNWLFKRGLSGIENEVKEIFTNFIDKTKPDIIHAHNMHFFSKVHTEILQLIAKKRKIPIVLTAHNSWDDSLFLELTRNIQWDHIIAVSHFIKREIMGAGIDDRNITVIHHGIDTEVYNPRIEEQITEDYPIFRNRIIVFHPARIGLAKGCDISVKALRLVKERFPEVLLVLAGSKNIIDWGDSQQRDIAYIVYLINIFNLKDNVFIDVFSLEEIPSVYKLAQICIYPSTVPEPFGVTMLESLASAKPIIVTNSGGMPEVIKDGINGFIIPIRDYEALASRMIQLLEEKRLRERLGYTGREIVEGGFTKEIMTKNTLRVYRKLLSKSQ